MKKNENQPLSVVILLLVAGLLSWTLYTVYEIRNDMRAWQAKSLSEQEQMNEHLENIDPCKKGLLLIYKNPSYCDGLF